MLGWDHSQARSWDAVAGTPSFPPSPSSHPQRPVRCQPAPARGSCDIPGDDSRVTEADLRISLDDTPVVARGRQPCSPRTGLMRLSVAETVRLTRLAAQATAGLISHARLLAAAT